MQKSRKKREHDLVDTSSDDSESRSRVSVKKKDSSGNNKLPRSENASKKQRIKTSSSKTGRKEAEEGKEEKTGRKSDSESSSSSNSSSGSSKTSDSDSESSSSNSSSSSDTGSSSSGDTGSSSSSNGSSTTKESSGSNTDMTTGANGVSIGAQINMSRGATGYPGKLYLMNKAWRESAEQSGENDENGSGRGASEDEEGASEEGTSEEDRVMSKEEEEANGDILSDQVLRESAERSEEDDENGSGRGAPEDEEVASEEGTSEEDSVMLEEEEEANGDVLQCDIGCVLLPCLAFHRRGSIDYNIPRDFPETISCNYNARKVELGRLGYNCDESNSHKDILKDLRMQADQSSSPALGGRFVLVLTSYEYFTRTAPLENDPREMVSVLSPLINKSKRPIRAIPLTTNILTKAIKWLRNEGSTNTEENSGENVEVLVKKFLREMEERIPSGNDVNGLKEFIRNHKWRGQDTEKFIREIDGLDSDMEKSYSLRQFIQWGLAKETKVVLHFVDGNHRAAALNCALVGFGKDDDVVGRTAYYENFPHGALRVVTTVIVPQELNLKFAHEMRKLSFEVQHSVASLKKHGMRELVINIMKSLHEQLRGRFLFEADETGKMIITDEIDQHIFKVALAIHSLYTNNGNVWNQVVPRMKVESKECDWTNLFKKTNKHGEYIDKFCYHCDCAENTIPTIVHRSGNFENEARYNRSPFKWLHFELAQLLLWSRLSQDTHTRLLNWLRDGNPSTNQRSAKENTDETSKCWISAMINAVTCAVYYSLKYNHVKKGTTSLPNLLMDKIKEVTDFFSTMGEDPEHPEWFRNYLGHLENEDLVRDSITKTLDVNNEKKIAIIKDKIKPPKNLISFITVAYAFHIKKKEDNKTTSISDYYRNEAYKTTIDDILEPILTSHDFAKTKKKTIKVSVSKPKIDAIKNIQKTVEKFQSVNFESDIINKLSNSNHSEKAEELKKKITIASKALEKLQAIILIHEMQEHNTSSEYIDGELGCA